ncbi:MAG: aspartate 1-decarboxylase [Chloroflexi bacterium RBG_16_50_11]|nr:MAG: aspartate 1-decarboxylase [Chloroflexi bacterium RBG_16_50_11]
MRMMLKSKIHRATVTDANINYEGSITIDSKLMKAADIIPYEQVHVLNVNNGARFTTYAIEGEAGSGDICLNGAAARLGVKGDLVIILTYDNIPEEQLKNYKPRVVHVNEKNEIITKLDEKIFA